MVNQKKIILLAVLVMGIITSGVVSYTLITALPPMEDLGAAPDFDLVDQDDNSVSLSAYEDVVLVIDFIYVECPTWVMCPLSTWQLRGVHNELLERGYGADDFHLLTISFDWNNDDPTMMKTYGEDHNANYSVWSLLSGTQDQVTNASDAYGIIVNYDAHNNVTSHSMLIHLVDRSGQIRAIHMSTMNESWDPELVIRQIIHLIEETP